MEVVDETVSEVIAHHLKNPASLFVFPSDVACTSWSDWAIKHTEQTHTRAFNLDQFAAWDSFKADFFKPSEEELTCIPAVLRKVFAEKVIAANNEKHLFKKLISSTEEMRGASFGFVDWIAKILPALKFLSERYTMFYPSDKAADEEDEDYQTLFSLYTEFLREAGLYEPSYVKERLKATERKIFIFYPEVLDDFYEFEDALQSAANVTLVKLPQIEGKQRCVLYEDARRELRFLALHLRKLHYAGVDLRRVAVSVPELDDVRSYIERELKSYAVPFVTRAGLPYTVNSAGGIFQKIKDCAAANFSYDSVRALLLDGFIPWKKPDMNEKLVREGYERRCVCSYEESDGNRSVLRDAWLSSLDQDSDERKFYYELKKAVHAFEDAHTFKDVQEAWFSFSDYFIDVDKFSKDEFSLSNKIMGRILSELGGLVLLEEKYAKKINYQLRSPFDFFVNEIAKKSYKPDEKRYGVSIFPYALAACADFDYQFVLDASQGSLATQKKVLPFISDEAKRASLHLRGDGEEDSAKMLVSLYALSQKEGDKRQVHFSAAQESFGGFSIVHSALEEVSADPHEMKSLEELDFVSCEKSSFWAGNRAEREVSLAQKSAFLHWRQAAAWGDESLMSRSLMGKIDLALKNKGTADERGARIKVSQTELNSFFFCPRKFVFKNVLTLQEDTLDVDLTKPYEIGNLVHKMIELACQRFKAQSGSRVPLFPSAVSREELSCLADEVFEEAKFKTSFAKSSLALKVIESQKRIICQTVVSFLQQFCSSSDGKTGGFGNFCIDGVEVERDRESSGGQFDYFGRIDCVLEEPSSVENKVVVDYKTGTLPNKQECIVDASGKLDNFQIACYVRLLEDEEARVNQALFYGVKKIADGSFDMHEVIVKDKKRKTDCDREDFDETLAVLERCAQYFFEKSQAKDFEPLVFKTDGGEHEWYGVKVFEKCAKCNFASICRTPFNIAKRALS